MIRTPPRLIIIDDDPKLAGLVGMIARETFPETKDLLIESLITAEAGVLAIRRASEMREVAIVVISDFHLPPSHLHGIDILAEAKRRIPTAKRALMTGRDPEELEHLLAEARLDAFVAKPFSFDEMSALIRRLVNEVVHETRSTTIPLAPTQASRTIPE